MCFLELLESALDDLVANDDRPVVVTSAMWPIFRALKRADQTAVDDVLNLLISRFSRRGLLMPSFSSGFDNHGRCDLDRTPSKSGILSETMRSRKDVVRTLSAWFSFTVMGSCVTEVSELMPVEAWGEGSLYEWMEYNNVCFLALGTHPTHFFYPHRLEWLAKDILTYRFNKTISGVLARNGKEYKVNETLFVRKRHPVEKFNDFTKLMPFLKESGMRTTSVLGVNLGVYNVRPFQDLVLPRLMKDEGLLLR